MGQVFSHSPFGLDFGDSVVAATPLLATPAWAVSRPSPFRGCGVAEGFGPSASEGLLLHQVDSGESSGGGWESEEEEGCGHVALDSLVSLEDFNSHMSRVSLWVCVRVCELTLVTKGSSILADRDCSMSLSLSLSAVLKPSLCFSHSLRLLHTATEARPCSCGLNYAHVTLHRTCAPSTCS